MNNYNKTTWKDGDMITVSKLNKIEQAISRVGGAIERVGVQEIDGNYVLDRTWQNIYDAMVANKLLLPSDNNEFGTKNTIISKAMIVNDTYAIESSSLIGFPPAYFTTDTPDGFPVFDATFNPNAGDGGSEAPK